MIQVQAEFASLFLSFRGMAIMNPIRDMIIATKNACLNPGNRSDTLVNAPTAGMDAMNMAFRIATPAELPAWQ